MEHVLKELHYRIIASCLDEGYGYHPEFRAEIEGVLGDKAGSGLTDLLYAWETLTGCPHPADALLGASCVETIGDFRKEFDAYAAE